MASRGSAGRVNSQRALAGGPSLEQVEARRARRRGPALGIELLEPCALRPPVGRVRRRRRQDRIERRLQGRFAPRLACAHRLLVLERCRSARSDDRRRSRSTPPGCRRCRPPARPRRCRRASARCRPIPRSARRSGAAGSCRTGRSPGCAPAASAARSRPPPARGSRANSPRTSRPSPAADFSKSLRYSSFGNGSTASTVQSAGQAAVRHLVGAFREAGDQADGVGLVPPAARPHRPPCWHHKRWATAVSMAANTSRSCRSIRGRSVLRQLVRPMAGDADAQCQSRLGRMVGHGGRGTRV